MTSIKIFFWLGIPPSGYDNNGGGYGAPEGSLGIGPTGGRPTALRCDDADSYKQMGTRQRMRRQYIRRFTTAQSLIHCQRECAEARDFICRSFNYRYIDWNKQDNFFGGS